MSRYTGICSNFIEIVQRGDFAEPRDQKPSRQGGGRCAIVDESIVEETVGRGSSLV